MLLAVDVGNTQTVFGLYEGADLGERWRIATEAQRTGDELGALLGDFLDLSAIDRICLSSTVPRLVPEYEHVAERWAKAELLVIGPGVRTGIPIEHDAPRDVGPDRIVNAVAAKELFGAPAIVADFGTSTNFDVVSPEGAYVGGVLAPGIEVSMEALFARAARLVKVDYVEPPQVMAQVFFDFRCVDLAMGSGHFLVAAVDRIEARLSALLAERPIAQIAAELERLRAAAYEALGALGEGIE